MISTMTHAHVLKAKHKVEYEALLVGLGLAKKIGVEKITALKNSRLATNQVS